MPDKDLAPVQDENPQEEQVVEGTFNSIVKELKKKLGNCKKCIVKNVNYEILDTYVRVSFTLRNEVDAYVSVNGTFTKGKSNIVFSSLFGIAGMLKEQDELAWIGNVVLSKPEVLNLLFSSAEIEIIQQEVKKGESYTNPFSTNGEPTVKDHDWIVNHIIGVKLSKVGQKVYDRMMDKILDF